MVAAVRRIIDRAEWVPVTEALERPRWLDGYDCGALESFLSAGVSSEPGPHA